MFRLREAAQELPECVAREVPWVQSEHPRSPDRPRGDQTVDLEGTQRLLHVGEGRPEHTGQLSRIALVEQPKGEEHTGP